MKSNIVSLGQQFLMATLATLYPTTIGAELQRLTPTDVQSRFADGNAYIRADITGGGGIFPLIDSSTLEKIGTSSFKGKMLTTGVKMAITRIRVGVCQVATTDTKVAAAQTYGNKYTDVDPALRAAHLVVSKDGKKFIDKPIGEFLTVANVEGMVGVADAYELDAFRYLEGDQELDIQISFPPNVTLDATKKTFFSLELMGPRVMAS